MKKKNIIIRGWSPPSPSLQKEVDSFLGNRFGLNVNASEEARLLGREKKTVWVKLRSFDDKLTILKRKKGVLASEKIFIDEDLTELQQNVQKNLRALARRERLNGRVAMVGRQRIDIQGAAWFWKERSSKFVPVNDPAKVIASNGSIPSFPADLNANEGPPGTRLSTHRGRV